MDYREVEVGEKEGPTGLVAREFLFCLEIRKVIMVSPDFEGLFAAFEVVAEVFQGADDGKEFFIMNVIIEFSLVKGLGKEGDWMPRVKSVRLFKDRSKGKVTGISDKSIGQGFTG